MIENREKLITRLKEELEKEAQEKRELEAEREKEKEAQRARGREFGMEWVQTANIEQLQKIINQTADELFIAGINLRHRCASIFVELGIKDYPKESSDFWRGFFDGAKEVINDIRKDIEI